MTKWQDTYYEEELPPGATRDYDSPNLRGVAFIIVCLLCFIISTSFGGVRIYTKVSITRAMGWDDCKNLAELAESAIKKPED